MRLSRGPAFLSLQTLSASSDARVSLDWPPVWQLPGLALRALWRLIFDEAIALHRQARQFLQDPMQRRKLLIFPLVLLGHVLLVWLLVQNRWLVMSEITIMIQPPVEASVILADAASKTTSTDNAITLPKPADGLDLKNDDELGISSLSVQNSVPWFNTTQLPDIRGTGQGRATKREPVRKTTRSRKQRTDVADKLPEPALTIPEPRPEVAVIPPPPPPIPPALPPMAAPVPRSLAAAAQAAASTRALAQTCLGLCKGFSTMTARSGP